MRMPVSLPAFGVKRMESRGQLPVIPDLGLAPVAILTQLDWLSYPAVKAASRYGRIFFLLCC